MPGLDINRFVGVAQEVANHLTCSICLNIFDNPIRTQCEHTFCKDCLQQCIVTNNARGCPECRTKFSAKRTNQIRDDPNSIVVYNYVFNRNLMANNLINDLKIKCDFRFNGCQEVIKFSSLSTHLKECVHRFCTKCLFPFGIIDRHNCVELMINERNQLKQQINDQNSKYDKVVESCELSKNEFKQLNDKYLKLQTELKSKVQQMNEWKQSYDYLLVKNKQLENKLSKLISGVNTKDKFVRDIKSILQCIAEKQIKFEEQLSDKYYEESVEECDNESNKESVDLDKPSLEESVGDSDEVSDKESDEESDEKSDNESLKKFVDSLKILFEGSDKESNKESNEEFNKDSDEESDKKSNNESDGESDEESEKEFIDSDKPSVEGSDEEFYKESDKESVDKSDNDSDKESIDGSTDEESSHLRKIVSKQLNAKNIIIENKNQLIERQKNEIQYYLNGLSLIGQLICPSIDTLSLGSLKTCARRVLLGSEYIKFQSIWSKDKSLKLNYHITVPFEDIEQLLYCNSRESPALLIKTNANNSKLIRNSFHKSYHYLSQNEFKFDVQSKDPRHWFISVVFKPESYIFKHCMRFIESIEPRIDCRQISRKQLLDLI